MAIILLFRLLLAAGIDVAAVEPRTLIGITQQVVGRRDRLEAFLGHRITRMQIRMVLLGELAVGLADIIRSGLRRHAEHLVWIVSHGFPAGWSQSAFTM